ncbi:hypothetical protein [Oerskovia sp. USHLN155]|uniref:hypothetical protein n=1 Tax=Oerskovia sp. USHLN155 TaxID=3081288 RepID=UPI003019E37B
MVWYLSSWIVAAVLVPAYNVGMMRCTDWYETTDNGCVALLGGLMFWNAVKFSGLAIASVGLLVRARFRERRRRMQQRTWP